MCLDDQIKSKHYLPALNMPKTGDVTITFAEEGKARWLEPLRTMDISLVLTLF